MEVLQGEHYLSHIEQCYIVREEILLSKQSEYLTSLHILEGQVHMCLVLEALLPIQSQHKS